MRAISLWQPWASLWLTEYKRCETRHWRTKHRGPLVVHAAARPIGRGDMSEYVWRLCIQLWGRDWFDKLSRGALIGVVNLIECRPTEFRPPGIREGSEWETGDWSAGRYAWQRGPDVQTIKPIPWKGRQGFFNVELP